jgi:GDPmannose 4,6-dehydratase
VNYREAYKMWAINGILFNHESPRRGPTFVTRKVTRAVARIKRGLQRTLYLGNLDAERDWGHARDFVSGMHALMQLDEPRDVVLATGEKHTVREFCELAFSAAGMPIAWRGERGSVHETAVRSGAESGAGADEAVIAIDAAYFRPAEVELLLGDPSLARELIGWRPAVTFEALVREMVAADLALVDKGDLQT